MRLRPFQDEALQVIPRKLQEQVNRQLVVWPTGLGKTVLFSGLPQALNLQTRLMTLVDRDELAQQAMDKLRAWNPGCSVGLEKADVESNGEQLVVASVQTLGRARSNRIKKFKRNEFGVLVIDETHKICTPTYRNIVQHFQVFEDRHRLLLGVTATPNRTDGQPLGEFYQEIVHEYPLLSAIEDGWLAIPRGVRVTTKVNIDSVRTAGGEFQRSSLSHAINTPERNDLIARTWLEKGEDRQTVFFSTDIAHALGIANAFKTYGVAAEAIWGDDPCRSIKLKAHRQGHLKVLVNCDLLTTGYDDWRISCIGMTRPTKSELLYRQIMGRGLRIQDDLPDDAQSLVLARMIGFPIIKSDCLVLDFVDVCSKHNLMSLPSLFGLDPTTDMHGQNILEVLEEKKKKSTPPSPVPPQAVPPELQLQASTENFDLLNVTYSPEILQLSKYQWHKTRPGCYVLLLLNNESVVVMVDLSGRWWVKGRCFGNDIFKQMNTLEEAIIYADQRVKAYGGTSLVSSVKREAPWHSEAPSNGQLYRAKELGITVLPGMTRGQLAKKINEVTAHRRQIVFQKNDEMDREWEALQQRVRK